MITDDWYQGISLIKQKEKLIVSKKKFGPIALRRNSPINQTEDIECFDARTWLKTWVRENARKKVRSINA